MLSARLTVRRDDESSRNSRLVEPMDDDAPTEDRKRLGEESVGTAREEKAIRHRSRLLRGAIFDAAERT